MKIIVYGFLLHVIFLISVFDIYFKSPIINNIPVQHNNIHPPAKRLVLFVADGLRADSLFTVTDNVYLSPYIRSIIEKHGAWGVAHCRVPTESRPGHIALIAGFYEDPSAVFTGWKENLVEFDSVFNRSFKTYSWGSPDILPMFKKGATENKIQTFCYNSDEEDFSGHGSPKLNTWVFDRFENFLNSAKLDNDLKHTLNTQGIIYFLHLLGPDVAGHASKPHSREYKENIRVVDEGVKRMEEIINEFYGHDNKTAFIFTSDHGMTDWGSHGAGSQSETEVPLIAWGAGVQEPQHVDIVNPHTPVRWNLQHLRRLDVAQADITPLMAVLIGASIPVHSVGELPLDYFSISDKDKVNAIMLNAQQLCAQFGKMRENIEMNLLQSLYTPYLDLTQEKELELKKHVEQLVSDENYKDAINTSKILIELSLSGLEYYHSYFQMPLLCCLTLSFLGWIVWLMFQLFQQHEVKSIDNGYEGSYNVILVDSVFLFIAVSTSVLIYVQSLPLQFYMYCCLPLLLWWATLRQWRIFQNIFTEMRTLHFIGLTVTYLLLLELLIMTFFKRWMLSLVLCVVGLWPVSLGPRRQLVPLNVQICWVISSWALAVFPALPVIGHQTQVEFVVLCGGLWLMFGLLIPYLLNHNTNWKWFVQLFMISTATAVIFSTSQDFKRGYGLRSMNQAVSWILLLTSTVMPLLTENDISIRFLSIGLGLAVPFLLLSIGHEAFFLLVLFFSLCVWIVFEAYLSKEKVRKMKFEEGSEIDHHLCGDDFRKCFFFLMYIILSFFGTGNIASVNSFDVSWVRCFLTVFSPFTMMTLILLKTLIPFLLVTCSFRAVNIFSRAKAENMFVIVLIYCDTMGLHFFYAVTNKGSWLEIGTSVSHFVIMEVTVLFLAALYYAARLYTGTVYVKEQHRAANQITPIWMPTYKKHPD